MSDSCMSACDVIIPALSALRGRNDVPVYAEATTAAEGRRTAVVMCLATTARNNSTKQRMTKH